MKKLALLLSIVCVLGGCQRKEAIRDNSTEDYNVSNGIREIVLKDGTKCVTVNGYGISCDWKH